MISKEEQDAIYSRMHEEWLTQPMTKLILSAIDKHSNTHLFILQKEALNQNVSDAKIRGLVISQQNTAAIKIILTDTTTLLKHLTTKEQ